MLRNDLNVFVAFFTMQSVAKRDQNKAIACIYKFTDDTSGIYTHTLHVQENEGKIDSHNNLLFVRIPQFRFARLVKSNQAAMHRKAKIKSDVDLN